ncbi:hypothetical protein SLA2020_176460 [Shorea laevis]
MQQPCSSGMQTMNSLLYRIPLRDPQNTGNTSTHQQIQNHHFHPTSTPDNHLEQMLTSLPSSTRTNSSYETARPSNLKNIVGLHYDDFLASKLRQNQSNGGGNQSTLKMMMQQQQMMMVGRIGAAAGVMVRPSAAGGDIGVLGIPLSSRSSHQNDMVHGSAFKSSNLQGGEGSVQALYNGFGGGSLHGTNYPVTTLSQAQHFNPPQSNSATAGRPKPRVRARRGQATDPHSVAERLRRERIAERMRALKELVPIANKTDKASMLDEIIDYVKFLQLQVKVLSMSRLEDAAAVADFPSEGGEDCIQTSASGTQTNESLTVMEHQVAKLMEEDMGAAMQYLQGKGLCLMPISLAATTTTTRCSGNPMIGNNAGNPNGNPLLNGELPSSPSMSVLTVQFATKGNGGINGSVKDAASISEP